MAIKPLKLPTFNQFQPDQQYLAQSAQAQYGANNQLAGINRTGVIDQADTSRNLQRLAQRQAQSQQGYNSNAARNGSLMSGRAMHGLGVMNTGYQQQTNDMNEALSRRGQDRTLQATGIAQGAPLQDQIARADLVERNRQRLAQTLSMLQPSSPYQSAMDNYWAKNLQNLGGGAATVSSQGIVK